ncbi:MAG TPA: GGDEF domain-containing protein [Nitrospira sp.]
MSNSCTATAGQYDPQVLLNSQPVIVTVIDPSSYKAVFQNQVSLGKFGDISNQACHEKIAACSSPCSFCKMPEAVQSGQITSSEVPLPNDEYLLVQWSKAQTTDGRIHVVETITDITQLKRQHKQAEILNQKLEAANRELAVLNQELRESSLRDGLTGLYNQSHFQDALRQGFTGAERSGAPLSLLFLDLDNFKTINDVFGHTTGDQVLRAIGRLLDNRPSPNEGPQIWRASDVTARYGGEEFAVLLADTASDGAVAFAERLRQHIMGLKRLSELDDLASLSFPLSCSIGVATFPTDATTSHELIKAADMAMYAAKQAGKNCVKVFGREIGVPEFLQAR